MGMEKYMGYNASHKAGRLKDQRQLPTYSIEGTDFYVDIVAHEFRQVDNAYNRITLGDVREEYGFSFFYYDTRTKNIYTGGTADLPPHVSIIFVPSLKELDPVGLARRQGFSDDYYTKGKSISAPELLPQLSRSQKEDQQKQKGKRSKNRFKI